MSIRKIQSSLDFWRKQAELKFSPAQPSLLHCNPKSLSRNFDCIQLTGIIRITLFQSLTTRLFDGISRIINKIMGFFSRFFSRKANLSLPVEPQNSKEQPQLIAVVIEEETVPPAELPVIDTSSKASFDPFIDRFCQYSRTYMSTSTRSNLRKRLRRINKVLGKIEDYAKEHEGDIAELEISCIVNIQKDRHYRRIEELRRDIGLIVHDFIKRITDKNQRNGILKDAHFYEKELKAAIERIEEKKKADLEPEAEEIIAQAIEISPAGFKTDKKADPDPVDPERDYFKTNIGKIIFRTFQNILFAEDSLNKYQNQVRRALYLLGSRGIVGITGVLMELLNCVKSRRATTEKLEGTAHEIVILGKIAANREGSDRLTAIGMTKSWMEYKRRTIIMPENVGGIQLGEEATVKSKNYVQPDGYASGDKIIFEIKNCWHLDWFTTGIVIRGSNNEEVVTRIIEQCFKYRQALEDGELDGREVRALEFHFTAPGYLHEDVRDLFIEIFGNQIRKVKIFFHPKEWNAENPGAERLVFDGAKYEEARVAA